MCSSESFISLNILPEPRRETFAGSPPCSRALQSCLVKEEIVFKIQRQNGIKPESLQLGRASISLAHHSASVTGTDRRRAGRVSCQPFCLPTSGGILVQAGLSLYIPAPCCHTGDYDAGGGSGGWRCVRGLLGELGRLDGCRPLQAFRLASQRRAPPALTPAGLCD